MGCAGPAAEFRVGCGQGHASSAGLRSETQGRRISEAHPGVSQQALGFEAEAGK